MTDDVVLHMQKVAGISGSEAHLLQLLPDLHERGWDVRFLMLHEDEPGAWEFAEALRAKDLPVDDIRLRADVDPIAFGEVAAFLPKSDCTVLGLVRANPARSSSNSHDEKAWVWFSARPWQPSAARVGLPRSP